MKTNKATQIIDNAFNSLIQSLENGHSHALRAYLQTMSRFHHYSLRNIMLIAMQRPQATRVAGFHAWIKLGRYVMKGEKGIAIVAPIVSTRDDPAESEDAIGCISSFKVVYVFDVAQTKGKELPAFSFVRGNPRLLDPKLNQLIAHLGISLDYSDALHCEGLSIGGKIVIKTGLPPAHDFAVRVHELAHEMLHKSTRTSLSKKQKETEAEAVAHVVCQAMGLDTNSAAADYIHLYHGDKNDLIDSFDKIKAASGKIIAALQ